VQYRVAAELDNGRVVETNNVSYVTFRGDLSRFLFSVLVVTWSNLAVRIHLAGCVKRDKERDQQWTQQAQENLQDIITCSLVVVLQLCVCIVSK